MSSEDSSNFSDPAHRPDPLAKAPLPPSRQPQQPLGGYNAGVPFPPPPVAPARPTPAWPQPVQPLPAPPQSWQQAPLRQQLPPPMPRWQAPQPEPIWPAAASEAGPAAQAPAAEAIAQQPRIPNLLIERQLRVISTTEHAADSGPAPAASPQPLYHNQQYHYSEAYSQAYAEPVASDFSLPFAPPERSAEEPSSGTPAPAASTAAGDAATDAQQRIKQLEKELAASQEEVQELSAMLEDLPEIFERKFQQRLQGVLDQQRLLIAENSSLRDRLFGLLPAAATEPTAGRQLQLPPVTPPRRRLGDRLRQALGWRSQRDPQPQAHSAVPDGLNRPDDERTRVA